MKYLMMTLAVVMIFAASALASDGNVSQNMMAKMGLSGMSIMSDAQGAAVRGMGYVTVSGRSVALLLGSSAAGGYNAVGGQLAAGASASKVSFFYNGCLVARTSATGCAVAVIR